MEIPIEKDSLKDGHVQGIPRDIGVGGEILLRRCEQNMRNSERKTLDVG